MATVAAEAAVAAAAAAAAGGRMRKIGHDKGEGSGHGDQGSGFERDLLT